MKTKKNKHLCRFSFEKKYVGTRSGLYEPKKGETGFSIIREDWVCRCGKTRREYLKVKCGGNQNEKEKTNH